MPATVLVSAAPAFAASCNGPGGCPTMTRVMRLTRGTYLGCRRLTLDGRPSTASNLGVQFSVTTPATTITDLSMTFWISSNTLTFTVDPGFSGWSTPTFSGSTQVVAGVTYYGYTTVYSATIVPIAGTTVVPFFFYSQCNATEPVRIFTVTRAIVNDELQQIQSGVTTI